MADEVQTQGLGKLLLVRLVAAARERSIARFRCEVLCSNTAMTALISQIAPDRTTTTTNGVMTVDFAIAAAEPATECPSRSMYGFFRAAATDAIEWTEAVRRFWRR